MITQTNSSYQRIVDDEDKNNANPLSNKINKLLEAHFETNTDTLDALRELSSFFTENSIHSRRNLRGQIEHRSVEISQKFVSALCDVKMAVDAIYQDVNEMDRECANMKKRLESSKTETNHLIQQTNLLRNQSQKLELEEGVAEAFVRKFQLSPSEISDLRGSSNDFSVSASFFDALSKTQNIRSNTKYLFQTGHQKTALDIMDQLNELRDEALQRLFQWAQVQTRAQEPSHFLPQGLAALQERPALFNMILEEWATVRRGWLLKGFLDALTIGGPGGSPRPIELQAHDPLRYVGDMLAWVHQSLPGEKEAVVTLLSKCVDLDVSEEAKQIVSSVSESLCRPLKTRVEQVVVSEQTKIELESGKKAVQLYKIGSLLQFYSSTISLVTGKSKLVSSIEEIQQLGHKMFISALQNHVNACCDRIQPPGETLAPCSGVIKTLGVLTDIVTAATVADQPDADFDQVVNCVVYPLINAITESASSLGSVEGAIYLLNCFHQLHSTLSMLISTQDKLEMIQGQIEAQLDTLVQEQVNAVFQALGLSTIYSVISVPPVNAPLSEHPSCQPLAIKSFVNKLDGFLASPDYLMLPHMKLLLSSSNRKHLLNRTTENIISAYKKLHSLVYNSEHGYQSPETVMPKSPEIVERLLL